MLECIPESTEMRFDLCPVLFSTFPINSRLLLFAGECLFKRLTLPVVRMPAVAVLFPLVSSP